jgi:hypothetical protein
MFAREDAYFAAAGETLSIDGTDGVLANDQEGVTTPLSAMLYTPTRFGSLTLEVDGSFRYEASPGFQGEDRFEYRVDDGQAFSAPVQVKLQVLAQPVLINEVVSSSASSVLTAVRPAATALFPSEKESPDWIELHNLASRPIDLSGYMLTDSPGDGGRWSFPPGTLIAAGGYLAVFASGYDIRDGALDEKGWLHTNFRLDAEGEYLALLDAGNRVLQEFSPHLPQQRSDVGYGVHGDAYRYLVPATPGASNQRTTAYVGLVSPVAASVPRGFYDQPQTVTLRTPDVGATIRYTLDGSLPTAANGQDYSGPLVVDKTTTLRAVAFRVGDLPSVVETFTYLFLQDVLRQSPDGTPPEGWAKRIGSQTFNFGMDPRIVDSPEWGPQMLDALRQVPSLSIVTDRKHLLDAKTGIYVNAFQDGPEWERPASVELITPDGSEGFQSNAGLRIRGGFSRSGSNPKHSFRLYFRGEYGDSVLSFPLFGGEGADTYQQIDLRTAQNNAWQFGLNTNSFLRDEFSRDTQRDMGQPYKRGRYYHLYLDGLYWGLYQTDERAEGDYAATYFGGREEDYDVIKAIDGKAFATDGSIAEWDRLWGIANRGLADNSAYFAVQGKNPDGTDNPALERHVDVDNLIDYMLVIFYTGNIDGPTTLAGINNFYAIRNRVTRDAWRFFAHDSEHTLTSLTTDNTKNSSMGDVRTQFNPRWLHQKLMANVEYRQRFADRVRKHFFDGGSLTPERVAARLRERMSQIDLAIIGESARWGDVSRFSYTKNDWLKDANFLLDTIAPQRTAVVVQQLVKNGFYSSLEPPAASPAGGRVETTTEIRLTTAGGVVYYTLDGSDPRDLGAGVSATARRYEETQSLRLDRDGTLRARVLQGTNWSPLVEWSYEVGQAIAPDSLRVSEVHYHPAPPSEAEMAAGFTDADEFEFIELVNPTSRPLDLTQVRLSQSLQGGQLRGVEFDFSQSAFRRLAPGDRVVIVENVDAFRARYGGAVRIAGQWTGGLSNRGDRITVLDGERALQTFQYADAWYAATDGGGASLEYIDSYFGEPTRWESRESWRPSVGHGGTPGTPPRIPGDVNGDLVFDSSDLVAVFAAGQYEDEQPDNSTFETGDWNGDGDFTSADFVLAFQYGLFRWM